MPIFIINTTNPMKTLTLLSIAVLATTSCIAQKIQDKEVPKEVTSSFEKQFQNTTDHKWEKEHGNYEVEFKQNNTEQSALFDAQGVLIETEIEIPTAQLPAEVLKYIAAKYNNQKIKEAAKITDANGTVTYEAELKGMDVLFDMNGKFIKEVKD